MITANVIHRVFRIKCGNGTGTAFTIDIDNRQYIVTAKHVLEEFSTCNTIEVFGNGNWNAISTSKIGDADGEIDISVLATDHELSCYSLSLEATSNGIVYGQDAYFLGFPFDILSKFIFEQGGYPLPLVKKATVSCFDGDVFLLDGNNNPGFSGGPVVYKASGMSEFRVAAVISGYKAAQAPVFAAGKETALMHQYNTGIIVSYDIGHAVDLINANPAGYALNSNGTEQGVDPNA